MDCDAAPRESVITRHLDAPPVWLLASGLAAWAVARRDPWALAFGGWVQLPAGLLIGGGLLFVLVLVAVAQMRQARTEVLPRREASSLVTNGVFRRSRNPICLGMALILLGWMLRLDAPLALPLLPVFMRVIEARFILGEEEMLARRFPSAWTRYVRAIRRWL